MSMQVLLEASLQYLEQLFAFFLRHGHRGVFTLARESVVLLSFKRLFVGLTFGSRLLI
jgi:hypothetical protein